MPRPCTVCTHPKAAEINAALLEGVETKRALSKRFDIHENALRRHEKNHRTMPAQLLPVVAPEQIQRARAAVEATATHAEKALGVFQRSLDILHDLLEAFDGAMRGPNGEILVYPDSDISQVASIIQAIDRHVTTMARVQEVIASTRSHDVTRTEEWAKLRGTILRVLADYPDARAALAREIAALE